MSLLQKASIITTPTAYAEDYLYSIKPAYALGSELVTQFDGVADGTDVATLTGWFGYGTATSRNVVDEKLVIVTSAGNQGARFSATTIVGTKYLFKTTASGDLGTSGIYVSSGSLNLNLDTSSGNIEVRFTALSTTTDVFFRTSNNNAGTTTYFDISLKEITDADFDFDRNSTGTRVNQDYVIEDVPYNLLTYSEEIKSSNSWIIQSGITVTNNDVLAPDGTFTADKLVGNGTVGVFKQVTNLDGVITRSVYLKSVTGNVSVTIKDPVLTQTQKTLNLNETWQRYTLTEDNLSATNIQGIWIDDIPASGIYMWGAQIVKGDKPKDYLKTTDRLDIPRIDYTNGEPSILLEPSRTNDILNNTNLSQWLIGAGITVTSNAVNSPEGIQNADKIEKTSQSYTFVRQSLGTGNVSVFSIFVKQGNYRYIGIRNNDSGHSVFDFETKTFVTSLSNHNLSVQQFPNGWFRLIDERTISTNTNGLRGIALTLADGTELHSDIPLNAFAYVWGGQLENNQTYATSLIHTSGSAVTRSADPANNAGNSDLINSTEGVLYAQIKSFIETPTDRKTIALSDLTNSQNVVRILYLNNSTNVIRAQVRASNSLAASMGHTVSTALEYHKVAIKYKENDFALWVDGKQANSDSNGAVPNANTMLSLSFSDGNNSNKFNDGAIKMVAVFKEALSDTELAKLTGYNNHELYMNYYNRLSYLGLVEEYNVESDINNYIL